MNLWNYQIEAKEFAKRVRKSYLAMGMGLGKSLTSLSTAIEVSEKSILLIAELNEIENSQNFKNELGQHFPHIPYYSLRKIDLKDIIGDKFVAGINPDSLLKLDFPTVIKSFDTILIDEASMAKNTSTARFEAIHAVCKTMKNVIMLSGTPMMNGCAEIYAPLVLLDHPISGGGTKKAREAFDVIFANGHYQKMRNTGRPWLDRVWIATESHHVRELRYLIRHSFFFKRKEDTDGIFKKKLRRVERLKMSPEWIDEYSRAWDDYFRTLNLRLGLDGLSVKKIAQKLKNVKELKKLIENSKIAQVNSKWKALQIVQDIAEKKYGNNRIIIFSMFIETDLLIQQELEKANISFRTFDEIGDWKIRGEQVLVGRIKAHGKGSNVPQASVVLFSDMDWTPSNNLQAENRVDRPEQQNEMEIVYYLTENEQVDEHIQSINKEKMEAINEFMRPFTDEEMTLMPGKIMELRSKFPKECALLNI